MNLDTHPRVIGLANALELDGSDPIEAIRAFCHGKIERFLRGAKRVSNMVELQQIVCVHLNLTVHEVWTDEDLEELKRRYIAAGEIVFATLGSQLSPDAFGVLFRLNKVGRRKRFAAVIDCRGDKHLRRYWTLWHEIAHCLTDVKQFELPLRRTTVTGVEKDPIEQLTDMIAADLAFYGPLFGPILNEELDDSGRVSFGLTERVRQRFCADASLASTINACVAGTPLPTIFVEAGLKFKKAERERIAAGETGIRPALRILKAIPNKAAREAGFHIPPNIRVPQNSVISRINLEGFGSEMASENLGDWTTSSGSGLTAVEVRVEARKSGDRVLALIAVVS
jgi:hypothetical protein